LEGFTLPPRLLFVVNESYFFMTHRLALAEAAQAAGYDVHVAAPDDHVWAPEEFSVDKIRQAGFEFHAIPLSRRGKNPIRDLKSLISLVLLFRRLRPDLLHLLTIKPVIYGGIAARLAGVKAVVSTITGLGQVFVAQGILPFVLKSLVVRLYGLATGHKKARVIVQNRGDRETIVSTGAVNSEKVRLVRGSGVSMEIFAMTSEPEGMPVVILPSRLIWEKGVAVFAAAAKYLKAEGVDARFALVGDTQPSNPRAVPKSVIEDWVTDGDLEWWGRHTDMPEVYKSATIVCLPSTYGEGVPKVLIEAAASGRPIVTAENPGCQEIVEHGVNGLVVPGNDAFALAEALKLLLSDPDLRKKMGQEGRKIVAAGFSEEQVISETLSVYNELVVSQ
jgi:glycosyltransferase involved in cell wall biosynthesis